MNGVDRTIGCIRRRTLNGTLLQRPLLDISEESFDRQFAVNVKGLLFSLQAVALRAVEQGRGGKNINMASQVGR